MATTSISNTYTGDGTTTLFSFTFPYIDEADVKIELDGVLQTNTYGFANATQIEFNTAPASGVVIYIYRETNVEQSPNVFYPGAAIRARDLNDNFTHNLYITEEARFRSNEAVDASELAQAAATAADASATAAQTAATTAQTAATTAQTQAAAAQASATAAQTSSAASAASAAQASSDAAQAATDAATAVSTANTASTNASTAVSTANAASTLATTADGKADTAIATANSATTTAQGADTKADTAIATANTANTTANSAVTTANTASTTANTAATNAQTALDAVGDVLDFDILTNVAAIPSSPSDADAIQVTNSSGIESFTPLTGLPSGFVGDSGIYVRLVYRLNSTSWEYITYAANDPDSRYVQANSEAAGFTVTSQTLTSDQAFDANVNAACIGPVAVDSGVTVTIGANSKLVVLN